MIKRIKKSIAGLFYFFCFRVPGVQVAHGTYLVKLVVNDKIYKAQVVYEK